MPNTQLAARKTRADNMPTDDHIAGMVVKARRAMSRYAAEIAARGQGRIDEAVTALAWSIYKPHNARRLASERPSERCAIFSGSSRPASSSRSPRRASSNMPSQ
jgi:hypothetical protein